MPLSRKEVERIREKESKKLRTRTRLISLFRKEQGKLFTIEDLAKKVEAPKELILSVLSDYSFPRPRFTVWRYLDFPNENWQEGNLIEVKKEGKTYYKGATEEDLKKIEARELEVHIKVLDFLEKHKGRYFDEKEIAERTDLPVKEVRQTIENTRVNIDYGEIDTIWKDGKEYFGIK